MRPEKLVWYTPWDSFEVDYIRSGGAGDARFLLVLYPLWGESSEKWRAVIDFGDDRVASRDVDSRADELRGAFFSAVQDLVLPELARRRVLAKEQEEMKEFWTVQFWIPTRGWMDIPGGAGRKSYAQGYFDGLRSILPRKRALRLVNAKGEEVERALACAAPSVPSTGDRARLQRAFDKGLDYAERCAKNYPHEPETYALIGFYRDARGGQLHEDDHDLYVLDCYFAQRTRRRTELKNPPEDAA